MTRTSHNGLIMPSLIWLAAIGAAFLGAMVKGVDMAAIWPLAALAAVPACISLLLSPVMRREWAQLLVIFAWLALAIVACVSIAFVPMAVLFLCAPAAAALFEKEKVVEAMVMAAIFAALLYYAGQQGYIPEALTTKTQSLWGQQAGLIATIGLLVSTMFGAASSKNPKAVSAPLIEVGRVFDAVSGGVMQFDEADRLVTANAESRDMFGLAEKAGGLVFSNLFGHDAETQSDLSDRLKRARASRERQSLRIETRYEGDKITYMDSVITPLSGGGFIFHAQDTSEQEFRVEALRRSHAMAEKETGDKSLFFAGVSHELRTPLNAIIGFSDMMRSRLFGPLPGKYAEYADLIHDSGQHMLDLIGDVLDMSKIEAGKFELQYNSFDAADVVRSTVKMIRPMADAAAVQMDIEITDDDPLLIEADRKAVRQILLNLLSNAIKFSHKGGRVVIAAKSAGDTLNLTVSDHGVGISAEDLETLGEPYNQAASARMVEERGTGLGLNLVKSLTELHGGRFAIASQPDAGTTVDIFLPLSRVQ